MDRFSGQLLHMMLTTLACKFETTGLIGIEVCQLSIRELNFSRHAQESAGIEYAFPDELCKRGRRDRVRHPSFACKHDP
jgi:hypothetical protein